MGIYKVFLSLVNLKYNLSGDSKTWIGKQMKLSCLTTQTTLAKQGLHHKF